MTNVSLFKGMLYNDELTENAMRTHSTSGSNVLDLFYKMGGSRNVSDGEIVSWFVKAFNENWLLALKAMFYNRDIRGGQGERRSFQVMFRFLCERYSDYAEAVMPLIAEYGRWDDLFVAIGTKAEKAMAAFVMEQLASGDVLLKKWMPREGKAGHQVAKWFMKEFGMSPKQYRKAIAFEKSANSVVEVQMSDNRWRDIDFSKVPSVATKKYRNAFARHTPEQYQAWLDALKSDTQEAKINAGAIFPHDIVGAYIHNRGWKFHAGLLDETLEAQWKALPDYVGDGLSFVPVVDVSGSMMGLPIQAAVSLGIYLAERNKSVFKNGFITFSRNPQLQIMNDSTLRGKIESLVTSRWNQNTNVEAVFRLILDAAIREGVSKEDMPTNVLILSDMQFDEATSREDNVMEMAERMFAKTEYEVPQLVFWNLRTSYGVPVKVDKSGVALVSGFSPSLMKSMLSGVITPLQMMLNVLNSKRYEPVEQVVT